MTHICVYGPEKQRRISKTGSEVNVNPPTVDHLVVPVRVGRGVGHGHGEVSVPRSVLVQVSADPHAKHLLIISQWYALELQEANRVGSQRLCVQPISPVCKQGSHTRKLLGSIMQKQVLTS